MPTLPSALVLALALALALAETAQDGTAATDSRICDRAAARAAGSPERAELGRFLDAAVAAKQAARTAFLRGCQRFAEGKPGTAIDEFEKAVKIEDGNAVYHFWIGRAAGQEAGGANPLRQPGLAKRARTGLERAVQLDPEYLDAREGVMQYYLQAPGFLGGSKEKAREQVAEIAKRNPYRGGMLRARLVLADHDTTAAIRAYEALVATHPDSGNLYSPLATLLGSQRKWDEAWAAIDRYNALRPDSRGARYALGRMAAESGQRLEEGEAALRGYLSAPPEPGLPSHAGAHWRLGMIAERRGDRPAARREYEAALKLDPALKGAKDGLGRLK